MKVVVEGGTLLLAAALTIASAPTAQADVDFSPGVIKYRPNTGGPVEGPTLYIRGANFQPLNQLKTDDTELYESAEWAGAPEEEEGSARKYWTCLATVYAMIEHARGNTAFRVGAETYVDTNGGAQPILGVVPGKNPKVDYMTIRAEIAAGNPVILQGSSASIPQGHFVLAISIQADGRIVAFDPFGGKTIKIDPANWKSSNASAPVTITAMRTVDF